MIFKFLETNVDSIEVGKEFTLINLNKITNKSTKDKLNDSNNNKKTM